MTQQELFIRMSLQSWEVSLKRAVDLFNGFSDEELYTEIAPGRNRVIYLLGHLTAVHDRMLPLLGLGERLYPQLDEPFLSQPDKAVKDIPSPQELREFWYTTNGALAAGFRDLTPDQWFQKHTQITDEDFVKEPHRNKLSVLLSRTSHLASHYGQILLAKKKAEAPLPA
ncbi:MAG TPA: DinB family protein [Chitinophagaceae bacterium]|jgi:hypothetical protein